MYTAHIEFNFALIIKRHEHIQSLLPFKFLFPTIKTNSNYER